MTETIENFENKSFNPFLNSENILLNHNQDPDEHFLNKSDLKRLMLQYFSVEESEQKLIACSATSFSILHINIRSVSKNVEKLKLLLSNINYEFSMISLTETWCSDDAFYNNTEYDLPGYYSIHQERKYKRGGGICVFIKNNFIFKQRKDLSISDEDNETLSVEIVNKNTKNIIVNTCYRPPNSKIRSLKSHVTNIFNQLHKQNKKMFFVGDFNINSLDYSTNTKVKNFIDLMFSKGMLSVINKPTRVSKGSATCIDHIYTNSFVNKEQLSGIITTDISDHFPVFIVDKNVKLTNYPDSIKKQIRVFNEQSIKCFKRSLSMTDWTIVLETRDPNLSYNAFLKQFLKIYEKCFPIKTINIKRKQLLSPWVTKGLSKSSKQKQKLYVKFLKHPTYAHEERYKNYKNLFEKLKNKSKIQHFSTLLKKHQNNSKETWKVMKDAIGKSKLLKDDFPRKLIINNKENFNQHEIASYFNNFFTNIGSNLAAKIPHSERHFTSYMEKSNNILETVNVSIEELEKAFSTLKINKACGFDDINPNIVKVSYEELKIPLFHICKNSLDFGIYPDEMKIAKIKPLYKSGDSDIVSNYRPISILPVFSKLLERIMYNRVYKHITKNNLLYEKQLGFQNNCSTEYAILQLTKEIHESFDKKEFTLGVFIDLSKAFDTVNHDILLTKLQYFGLNNKYIKWFTSYLNNRKQFVCYGDRNNSSREIINCGVPQGSILGPLLFLLYVNDLCNASEIVKPIMFADDTNIFLSAKNIKQLFQMMNAELKKIQNWFNANKLSLNASKTKSSFFHPLSYADRIPLRLPELKINNTIIKREENMKFLGVILDENMTWRHHIKCIESKVSKNLGILYKARHLLNLQCTKQLYFSFIHTYLNYGNLAWGGTNKTKLSALLRRQKHASRIIYFKDKYTHAKPLLKRLNALNIYQLNINNSLLFMHKVRNNNIPNIFKKSFKITVNKYNTKSANKTFYKPLFRTKYNQFSMTYRGPHLWNSLVADVLVDEPFSTFKNKIKKMLFDLHESKTEAFF